MRFVLASESERRVDLLRLAGYSFEALKSGFPEETFKDPEKTVTYNARGKALAVARRRSGEVVLGSDTVVYLPEERLTFGQAKDEAAVCRMLGALEGRVHEVYSGVAVARDEEVSVRHALTEVRVRSLSQDDVSAYAALGEGVGKAGGYAIQGKAALLVEWVGGDYTNVVGLPLALTSRMLEGFGVRCYRQGG